MQPEDRGRARSLQRHATLLEFRVQVFAEPCGPLLQLTIHIDVFSFLKRRQPRPHAHGIGAERARLIDGAHRRHQFHQVTPAAVSRHGKPAPDNLAISNEIGAHAKYLRHSTESYSKAEETLSEDYQ